MPSPIWWTMRSSMAASAGALSGGGKRGKAGGGFSTTATGPGIPADQHEQVFKRFYRLEQNRYTAGNGLGLSLVAAVAHLHDARIEMRDNAPGLQFRLWFPAASGQSEK